MIWWQQWHIIYIFVVITPKQYAFIQLYRQLIIQCCDVDKRCHLTHHYHLLHVGEFNSTCHWISINTYSWLLYVYVFYMYCIYIYVYVYVYVFYTYVWHAWSKYDFAFRVYICVHPWAQRGEEKGGRRGRWGEVRWRAPPLYLLWWWCSPQPSSPLQLNVRTLHISSLPSC